MQENSDIVVEIPARCYLSPDVSRVFPYPFSFKVMYGILPTECKSKTVRSEEGSTADAIKSPQVVVSGMEQLLPEDKIGDFVANLTKAGTNWSMRKAASGSDVIMEYAGEAPDPDFCFTASTEQFVCEAEEKGTVLLTVQIKNFPGIEDYSYHLSITVVYAPWAKSLSYSPSIVEIPAQVEVSYEWDGDFSEKQLWQDGIEVETARSPYIAQIRSPSLFELKVFNDMRISDSLQMRIDVAPPEIIDFSAESNFFEKGQAVRLTWKLRSVSEVSLDGFVIGRDKMTEDGAIVYPALIQDEKNVCYTLQAYGYKDGNDCKTTARVLLFETKWKNLGAVSGYFAGDVYQNPSYQGRLFRYEDHIYAYAHPSLYRSSDGLSWESAAQNTVCSQDFSCLAANYSDGILYIMGKQNKSLYISTYDFRAGQFSCSAAGQICNSNLGGFAFSKNQKAYFQVVAKGMQISREQDGKWNAASSVITAADGMRVLSGDYCFFKKNFYAALLCSAEEEGQKKLYIYSSEESMEEPEYVWNAGEKDSFVCLVSTENELYILTDSMIAGYRAGRMVDSYFPTFPTGSRPWLGQEAGNVLMGIFPDKNKWNY